MKTCFPPPWSRKWKQKKSTCFGKCGSFDSRLLELSGYTNWLVTGSRGAQRQGRRDEWCLGLPDTSTASTCLLWVSSDLTRQPAEAEAHMSPLRSGHILLEKGIITNLL